MSFTHVLFCSYQPALTESRLKQSKHVSKCKKSTSRRVTSWRPISGVYNPSASDSSSSTPAKWRCMKNCGACCKLGDFDMEVLREMLRKEDDVVEYLSMIGPDGWCKWFNSSSRTCTKYNERPRFCRATPEVFEDLYGVEQEEFDEFAISCCEYHIGNIYGEESYEATRFRATPHM